MTRLGMEHGTSTEYHVLLRMWGRLQNDVSTQNQAHAKALRALESEVLRLRADLLITRTALCWGMGAGGLAVAKRPLRRLNSAPATQSPAPSAADEVLCRTACEGHAHHWLDEDHGCARTGQACHRLSRAG